MKNLLKLGLAVGAFLLMQTSVSAQDTPDGTLPEHALTHPTIVKIEYPNEKSSHRDQPAVSTNYQKYVGAQDTDPIEIQRDKENVGKLFIKGRGTLNHVRIFVDSPDSENPVLQHTFRGVNFEDIDIRTLADGDYIIESISPHSVTQIPMHLKTIGTN